MNVVILVNNIIIISVWNPEKKYIINKYYYIHKYVSCFSDLKKSDNHRAPHWLNVGFLAKKNITLDISPDIINLYLNKEPHVFH